MKFFKRALSSVLAFVMTFGVVMTANVSSVFAAVTATATSGTDTSIKAISADIDSYLYYFTMPSVSSQADTEITANDNVHKGSVKLTSGTVDYTINGTSLTGQKASSKAANNVIKGVKAGQTVVFDLYMNSSTAACTLSFKMNSTAKTSPDTSVSLTDKASYQVSVYVDDDSDLYFYNDQQLAIANIGVKSTVNEDANPGVVTLSVNGSDYGTTSVTVGSEALVSGNEYDADSEVVVTATPNEGYSVTVTINEEEVKLTNNSYTFQVNGKADIAVTYEESKDICKYNISNTGIVALEDGKITFSSQYTNTNVVAPYVTPVYLEDGTTETPFTKGALPNGSSGSVQVTMDAGDTVVFYYTSSDSNFTKADQSKDGSATVTNSAGAEVAKDSNTAKKKGNYAYKFSYTATVKDTYTVKTDSGRFVVYGIDYITASVTTVEVTPTYKIGETVLTEGTVTIEGTEYSVGPVTLKTGEYEVTYTDGDKNYKGTLTVTEGDTAPVVTLTEVVTPTTFSATAEFRVDPAVTSDNVTYTGSTFNGSQHGIQNGTITITGLIGATKVRFGGCQYGTGTITITASDGTNSKQYTTSNKTSACENGYTGTAIPHTQYVDWYFDYANSGLTAPVTLTCSLNGYLPYLEAETVEYIPSDYRGKTVTVDPSATVDGTNGVFNSVKQAMEAISVNPPTQSSEGVTLNIADGTYRERVVVSVPYITFNGTSAAGTIISYNDSETNNDTYFHGATVAVVAEGFKASNITFQNTAEIDGAEATNKKNATAFSVGYQDGVTASAELTNCVLDAVRDTVYTGKTNSTTTVTFNGCNILGFQDVICGKGTVTLNNCTWDINSGNAARLFAPTFGSTYTATNLNIKNSIGSYNKSYFARGWGDGTSAPITVVVDGFTDSQNCIVSTDAINADGSVLYGFEKTPVAGTMDITEMFWASRKAGDTYFHTTLAKIDKALAVDSITATENADEYRIIAKANSALTDEDITTNIDSIGFVVSGNGNTVDLKHTKIYNVTDESAYYTVDFVTDAAGFTYSFAPYTNYIGYDVVGTAANSTVETAE